MATSIVTPDQDAIVSEIQIGAAPERVFKALSDAGVYVDRELARRHGAEHRCALGAHTQSRWNARESHAHRPRVDSSCAQGLLRRMAWRRADAEEVC